MATATASGCTTSVLDVVAHEDDSIDFQTPDIQHDIANGVCLRTVFVTAGDDGRGLAYAESRESGVEAAYAQMAGTANTWTTSDAGASGHPIPVDTLDGNTKVSLAFMRLPDGNVNGQGFPATYNVSLQMLWQGTIPSMTSIDGASTYTGASLTSTLTYLMSSFGATAVMTQDFVGQYGDGDHSDHHTVAYFTEAAGEAYSTPHTLTGYAGYPVSSLPSNVSASDAAAKQATWFVYAPYDPLVCQTVESCTTDGTSPFWTRQYITATVQQPSGTASPTPSSSSGPSTDLALSATATASSQDTADGQLASKAIDGVIDGYPGDYTKEWATNGQGTGAWLTLTWPTPQPVTSLVLYDRPNTNDQITGGTITFSDGSTVKVGSLPNAGTAYTLTFAAKTITSLTLTVTQVSSSTINVGLSEIQAYGSA